MWGEMMLTVSGSYGFGRLGRAAPAAREFGKSDLRNRVTLPTISVSIVSNRNWYVVSLRVCKEAGPDCRVLIWQPPASKTSSLPRLLVLRRVVIVPQLTR